VSSRIQYSQANGINQWSDYNLRKPELYFNLQGNSQAQRLLDFGDYVNSEIPQLTKQLRNERDCELFNIDQNTGNVGEVADIERAYQMAVQEYFQSDNISGDSCAGQSSPFASKGIDPLFQFDTDSFFQDASSATLGMDFFSFNDIAGVGGILDAVADSGYNTLEQSSGSGNGEKDKI